MKIRYGHLTEGTMKECGQTLVLRNLKIYKVSESFWGAYMSTISAIIRDI